MEKTCGISLPGEGGSPRGGSAAAGPGAPRSTGPGRRGPLSPRRCVRGGCRLGTQPRCKTREGAKVYEATLNITRRAENHNNNNNNNTRGEERASPAGRKAAGGGSEAQPGEGRGPGARCVRSPPLPPAQPFPCVYYRGGLGAGTGARKSAGGSRGAGPRPHAIPGASGRGEPRNPRAVRPRNRRERTGKRERCLFWFVGGFKLFLLGA